MGVERSWPASIHVVPWHAALDIGQSTPRGLDADALCRQDEVSNFRELGLSGLRVEPIHL